jgi:hypothetical protein
VRKVGSIQLLGSAASVAQLDTKRVLFNTALGAAVVDALLAALRASASARFVSLAGVLCVSHHFRHVSS